MNFRSLLDLVLTERAGVSPHRSRHQLLLLQEEDGHWEPTADLATILRAGDLLTDLTSQLPRFARSGLTSSMPMELHELGGLGDPYAVWSTLLALHLARSLPWRCAVPDPSGEGAADVLVARAEKWLAAQCAAFPRLARFGYLLDDVAKDQLAMCVPCRPRWLLPRSDGRAPDGGLDPPIAPHHPLQAS